MNARMISDQIIQRSRDMYALSDLPRAEIRTAIIDLTVAVAKQVADNYCVVASQQNRVSPVRGGKVLRDMRTLWRAVMRNVRKIYDTHPIHEKYLFMAMAAYYPDHARAHPKLLDHYLTPQQCYRLLGSGPLASNIVTAIKQVLEAGYGEAQPA